MQQKVENIIYNLSIKYGIPEEVIKAAVVSQFECARDAAKQGVSGESDTFLNVRFKHLGLLVVLPGVIDKITRNCERRNSSDSSLDSGQE